MRIARFSVLHGATWHAALIACVVAAFGASLPAAEPKPGAAASSAGTSSTATPAAGRRASAPDRLPTEIDISGPYNANIGGDNFPAEVEIWGPKAQLKISMDGQDRPMLGRFLNNQLQVIAKYGAANFNLTTLVDAKYDGRNFVGIYRRSDDKLGVKNANIVLSPVWHGGGGGGLVKMPVPRRAEDIPGKYGISLKKDGFELVERAEMKIEDGMVKLDAGGRRYIGDYSDREMFPVFWEGNRMDIFQLIPTETGFKGKLVKEVDGKQETFEILMGKGRGGSGGGHDFDWTYVYDVVFGGQPPVWIGKLALHDEDARLTIDLADGRAALKGSLTEGVLSATGNYGKTEVSIRAQQTANGFAGVYRQGAGNMVREANVVLRNRAARAGAGKPTW